ncbi:hypothetical protein FOXYSP1_09034 [Fusarium oxysporum f. sp. phaseoli]
MMAFLCFYSVLLHIRSSSYHGSPYLYDDFHTVGEEFREYEGIWSNIRMQSGSQHMYFIQFMNLESHCQKCSQEQYGTH